jgi:hypothetical protein
MPVANIKSTWKSGDLVFEKYLATANPQVEFGVDATGLDVIFYGDTTGKSMLWDESNDQLYLKGSFKFHDHLSTDDYALQLRTEYNAATGNYFGMDCEVHQQVSRSTGGVRGLSVSTRIVAGTTWSSIGAAIGIYAQIDPDATFTSSATILAALYGLGGVGGVFTAVGHLTSLWVDSHQAETVNGDHELIYMTNNGASTMDQAFYLYCNNNITNWFAFDTCTGMISNTATTSGSSKKILIDIDNTSYYINAYTG